MGKMKQIAIGLHNRIPAHMVTIVCDRCGYKHTTFVPVAVGEELHAAYCMECWSSFLAEEEEKAAANGEAVVFGGKDD